MVRRLPSVAAVVLALAVGIALGAGPLTSAAKDALVSAPTGHGAAAVQSDAFGDSFARRAGPQLYGRRLSGHPVALLAMPGADESVVNALAYEVRRAGGGTPTTWNVGRSLTSTGDTTLVDTLGSQLLEQVGPGAGDPKAPAYERIGQIIGSAIATRAAGGEAAGPDNSSIRESLAGAHLVTGHTDSTRLAPIVMVVLGDDVDDRLLTPLLTGLHGKARALVVTAAERRGDLAAASTVTGVTTVDGDARPVGRIAAVLAAIRALDTPGGSFGASGSDGPFPLG
ncbi:MAG TPA: copper transporter [Nocardioides sp.]|nr:copper transporter [Nocardioides sp.]